MSVDGVGKRFCRDLKRSLWYGTKDVVAAVCGREVNRAHLRPSEFWAVDDVSFELKRGQCLALLGRNGAGKTTLLKMLNGLIRPDKGQIVMRGRVSALIALGAGFNPILTGRENVYVNGAVLGLTKREIDARFDEIVAFAELDEFIDTPVQSYSSGMHVRLGFAVATALQPDILLLDEVLAVGDAAFRNKCYQRMASIQEHAAVVFVSHNMEQVGRVCDLALVIQRGTIAYLGDIHGGIDAYEKINEAAGADNDDFLETASPIEAAWIEVCPNAIAFGSGFSLRLVTRASHHTNDCMMRVLFYNASGSIAAEWNSVLNRRSLTVACGESELAVDVPSLNLKPGKYKLGLNLFCNGGKRLLVWSYKQHHIEINGAPVGMADYQLYC